MQAFDSSFTNVKASAKRPKAVNNPGQVLSEAHVLGVPSSVSRPLWAGLFVPTRPKMVASGQSSHGPPPSPQAAGESMSDQQRNVPTAPPVSSITRRVHVPFTAAPESPTNALRLSSGRKVPTNGAEALVIELAALWLKIV